MRQERVLLNNHDEAREESSIYAIPVTWANDGIDSEQ